MPAPRTWFPAATWARIDETIAYAHGTIYAVGNTAVKDADLVPSTADLLAQRGRRPGQVAA